MKYMYSHQDNMFYPYALQKSYEASGTWPETGVDVDEATFIKFNSKPPEGMVRIVGSDGKPAWGNAPEVNS
ncbi:MAG: hypothetical protein RSD49_14585 [Hafnia sp.]